MLVSLTCFHQITTYFLTPFFFFCIDDSMSTQNLQCVLTVSIEGVNSVTSTAAPSQRHRSWNIFKHSVKSCSCCLSCWLRTRRQEYEEWSRCWNALHRHSLSWPPGVDSSGCIEVYIVTLLLSWCIPSVNIVNMSLSQSLVSSLLLYSMRSSFSTSWSFRVKQTIKQGTL